MNTKDLLKKYGHGIYMLYFFIYLPTFLFLEKHITDYNIIHCTFDDLVPFCEIFIIPYYMWFLYIAASYVFLFLVSKEDFVPMAQFLTIGMTVFLIVSAVFPNGLPSDFRPELDALGRNNIFIDMVRALYSSDTSTNVFPSIHVFNSIGVNIALTKTKKLKMPLKIASNILCVLICLSTLFLKQHSVIDLIGGVVMAALLYYPFFGRKK